MRSRVELFEAIRRDHEREDPGIRELARRHRVHRRTVRQALDSATPPPRKAPEGRSSPKLGPYLGVIEGWLRADLSAPLKQRHTARRVHQRLAAEHGAEVSERQVRRAVAKIKRGLGLGAAGFVPQAHEPGAEAEVDFGQANATVAEELRTIHLFVMRLSYSGASYVRAFERANQLAFLEGHVGAFEWLGGVPERIRYDNLSAAVSKLMRGRRRVETDRFIALRSHYLFESFFCTPGEQGAHEMGGVEGEVGRFRRAHLVPAPEAADMAELNQLIKAGCEADLDRTITGRFASVGELLTEERPRLRRSTGPFDHRERSTVRVDSKAQVTVRQNRYSVPCSLIDRKVEAVIGAAEIEIWSKGEAVAIWPRCWQRHQSFARLGHYTPLLRRKPGALAGSLALAQERSRGVWPSCFDELWKKIAERTSPSEAARQMVEVVMLAKEHDPRTVQDAVEGALAAGAHDGRAVALLAAKVERRAAAPLTDLDPDLARASAPEPDLGEYDRLLGEAG